MELTINHKGALCEGRPEESRYFRMETTRNDINHKTKGKIMSIKIGNDALNKCKTVQDVINLINNDFSTDAEPETVAAAYAMDAAEETGAPTDIDEIDAHLEFLIDNGAQFNYYDAFKTVVKHIIEKD